MLSLTEVAASKVKEIMGQQNPAPAALRVAVVGGGCSGFSYHMAFDNRRIPPTTSTNSTASKSSSIR